MGTSSNDAAQEQEKWETLMTPPGAPDDHKYPSGLRLVLLMISLYVAMFLVALVQQAELVWNGLHAY
ncbi:hypothetical protein EYZ11_010010 [Aspergillus tanneri]|uniref:Uncharacterized protein n=1 Tax=Aspergillus tanneri TaxID=1220188 RepID=A0A4S3J6F1_9EURO|nr:hypothetical protein EYZ11_010010 [Aspergillus tanneri]